MDIKHLRYFISIIDNNFNLSHTAEELYISQPALSYMINDFEKNQDVKLFTRKNGKLSGLTYSGEVYYRDALEVIEKYDTMLKNLHNLKVNLKGEITIGIPPLVISAVFSDFLPDIILENPDIKFIIKELGAHQLREELLIGNVDLAVLLKPERIHKNLIDSYTIQSSELAVFVSKKNHLAKKKQITWQDLHKEKMAIFDESFMIHHYVKQAFERHHVSLSVSLQSWSWDFLLNSTRINRELFTLLPKPIASQYPFDDIVMIPMKDPIPWTVTICQLKKETSSNVESYILESLLSHFNSQKN
ncbi:LysR family transcriptional regulator [Candidatus Enterococcus ferrettii]|uniref:HTH lysR-type domain-containing protein n=1 Tax=Candidatus Enterococcus ferrettii TaxID=2815324 RepID=A0ABV0ELY0_9ENTE|nr:LysR family transcriptional regulator [Enterococcus sp. 665A]MBO1338316.1 LysR family transcriptional regulator [Enterococcus sp. 665A]